MNKKCLTRNNKKSKPKRVAHIFSGADNVVAEGAGAAVTNGGATVTTGAVGAGAAGSKAAEAVGKAKNIGGMIGGIAQGVSDIVASGMANAEVNTTDADNAIDAVEKFRPSTASLDSLTQGFNGVTMADTNHNYEDFMVSPGTALKNMGKAAVSGAVAGSSVNVPWGTIAGAVTGLIGAGAGWAAGRVKAEAEAERLNMEAQRANNALMSRTELAKDTIMQNQRNDFMQNIAAYGGPTYNHTGDWSNGLMFINEGGTHEENPNDGVLISYDDQGIPNLVEEGEVIYKDYVFSNRLKPYKKQLETYGLDEKYKDWTFAKIVEDTQKISAENPMDKISIDSLDEMMNTLTIMQEEVRRKKGKIGQNKLMSYGGKRGRIFDGKKHIYTEIGPGFSTGTNPLSLVDGEFVGGIEPAISYGSWTPSGALKDAINNGVSFDFDYGQNMPLEEDTFELEDPGLINTPLPLFTDTSWIDKEFNNISNANTKKAIDWISNNGPGFIEIEEEPVKERLKKPVNFDPNDLMQAAPIINSALSAIHNATTPIDTSNLVAEEAYSSIPEMVLPEIGGKITYKPTDKNAGLNTIINQGRTNIRDIQNSTQTSGMALAGILNNNFNTQRASGEYLLNADKQDLVGQLQVGQHNFGIDKTNLASAQAEQAANSERAKLIAMGKIQDAQGLEALQQMKGEATNLAMNNAIQGVADLGRQNKQWNWIKKNPSYADAVKVIGAKGGRLLTKKRRK